MSTVMYLLLIINPVVLGVKRFSHVGRIPCMEEWKFVSVFSAPCGEAAKHFQTDALALLGMELRGEYVILPDG